MLVAHIVGAAKDWVVHSADCTKFEQPDGEEQLLGELSKLYECDKFDKLTLSFAELKFFTRQEANRSRPSDQNKYEYFLRELSAKVERLKEAQKGRKGCRHD